MRSAGVIPAGCSRVLGKAATIQLLLPGQGYYAGNSVLGGASLGRHAVIRVTANVDKRQEFFSSIFTH